MRRNDLDICADILKVAKDGAKKTQLVYRANLNFKIVKKYIERLCENGLLVYANKSYFTTERGSKFINRYHELVGAYRIREGMGMSITPQ